MKGRWEEVRWAAGTVLIAVVLAWVPGVILGGFFSLSWRTAPGWIAWMCGLVSLVIGGLWAGMIRGYLPALDARVSGLGERFYAWTQSHVAKTVAAYALLMGSFQFAMTHDPISGLIAGAVWAPFGWLMLRQERRRRGPAPS